MEKLKHINARALIVGEKEESKEMMGEIVVLSHYFGWLAILAVRIEREREFQNMDRLRGIQ
jgi:hypothetical protein